MSKYVKAEDTAVSGTVSFDLSTNLLPIITVNLYGVLEDLIESLDRVINDEYYRGEQPDFPYIDFGYAWRNDEVMDKAIEDIASPIIEEAVREVLPSATIIPTEVYHPKYYNFESDELYFTLTCNAAEYNRLFNETVNNPEFEDYLRNHYSSYDGFISYMANNLRDFYEQVEWRQAAQVIAFNLDDDVLFQYDNRYQNKYDDEFMYYFDDNWDTMLGGWEEKEYTGE